jgi:putative Holliday junction resolvase
MIKSKATRIIGIDFGLVRIGIAYSDERKIIASALMTLTTEKKLEMTIEKLLKELEKHQIEHNYTIEEMVVGLPLMMSGKQGLIADEVKHFVDLLGKAASFPIVTWDERLTSVQAERSLMEFSMSRKKRSKIVDRISAVIILQNYLDSKSLKLPPISE